MPQTLASQDLQATFEAVCRNETYAGYRDLEPDLYAVASALLAGWRPDLGGLTGLAAARAGYLIDLLRGWMPAERASAWGQPLRDLAERDRGHPPAPFFHADPAHAPCHDDLATAWGLARGVNVSRLRQGLEGAV
jgi:hypothetical protein